jgi:hypothetical protein
VCVLVLVVSSLLLLLLLVLLLLLLPPNAEKTQTVPEVIKDKEGFLRLWYHECLRVFSDRLVSHEDRSWFQAMMGDKIKEHFNLDARRVINTSDGLVIYGNYIDPKAVNKVRPRTNKESRQQAGGARNGQKIEALVMT